MGAALVVSSAGSSHCLLQKSQSDENISSMAIPFQSVENKSPKSSSLVVNDTKYKNENTDVEFEEEDEDDEDMEDEDLDDEHESDVDIDMGTDKLLQKNIDNRTINNQHAKLNWELSEISNRIENRCKKARRESGQQM